LPIYKGVFFYIKTHEKQGILLFFLQIPVFLQNTSRIIPLLTSHHHDALNHSLLSQNLAVMAFVAQNKIYVLTIPSLLNIP
jgi:hypothetical protein